MAKRKKKTFFDKYDYTQLEPSSPKCEHFGSCGGCSFQNIKYESQIKLKEDYLKKLFSQEVSILPAANPLNYRNRMDFVYQNGSLGFRKKGDFKTVIPITKCHLIPSKLQEHFSHIQSLLEEYEFPHYAIEDHVGFLKYIVFRYAKSTNQLMLIITTATPVNEQEEQLREFISKLNATSMYWFVTDSITDVSIPFIEPKEIIGQQTITEKIGTLSYELSPFSFFQANVDMSKIIFDEIKQEVSGETVDLCCGVGSIGLYVSDMATSITGIEEVAPAIELAKKNKEQNNIKNATFFASDMKYLLEYAPLNVETLILDPPRAGLGKKVIKRIKELSPEKIIYMSCNPKTQKIDLDMIEGYELQSLKGFDQFPQTPHVETLAVLKRNISDNS